MVLVVKNPPANAGDIKDVGSVSRSGRYPGGENDNPTLVFLPGKSHGEEPGGLHPMGSQELGMT